MGNAARFALIPLVALLAAATAWEIVDAAGAFTIRAGHPAPGEWLAGIGFLALVVTATAGLVFAASPVRKLLSLAWLLAPLCAAYYAAYLYSYDSGADGHVPRYVDEHPGGFRTWAIAVAVCALVAAVLTYVRPRIGLVLTTAVAVSSALPIIGMALGGH